MNHKVRGGRKEDLLGFTTVRSRIQSYVMQTRNYSPNEKVRSMEGREGEKKGREGENRCHSQIFIQSGSPKHQIWTSRLGRPGDPYHSSQNHTRFHRIHHTRSAHGSFPFFLENVPEIRIDSLPICHFLEFPRVSRQGEQRPETCTMLQ